MAIRLATTKPEHLVRFVPESTHKKNMEVPFLRCKKDNLTLCKPATETTT
jgi:hypothetical protein